MITYIHRSKLEPHPDNPRKELGDLSELAASIQKQGLLQNLTVIPSPVTPDKYRIVIGHRRFAASEQAGLEELPCIIDEKMTYPEQIAVMYTYMGWSGSLVNITAERTLVARYSTAPSIKVTFANYDGTTLYTAYCTHGGGVADPITAGLIDEPTRPDNESSQLVYTYAGWNKTFNAVTTATTVTATYTGKAYYIAKFVNYDSTELYSCRVWKNGSVSDPVEGDLIEVPTKPAADAYGYIFKGWSPTLSTNMTANVTYTAQYKTDRVFTVLFVNYDGTVLDTQYVSDEGAAVEPVSAGRIETPQRASESQYSYTWSGWSGSYSKITDHTTITATYTQKARTYTVRFWDGENLMATVENVAYNGTATYPGTPTKNGVDNPGEYLFNGWTPVNTSIVSDTDCYATWLTSTIEDSWSEIFAAVDDGSYATRYAVGDTKALDLGSEGMVFMQIAAFDADVLANGGGKAPITWISEQLLATSRRMNPSLVGKVSAIQYDPNDSYCWASAEDVADTFQSTNQAVGNSTSYGCWNITPSSEGTLTINWTVDSESASYDYLDVYIDGTAKVSNQGGTEQSGSFTVPLTVGTNVQVFTSYKKDGSGDKGTDTATVAFSADVDIAISVVEEVVTIREAQPATEGTGAIGGWEQTELRAYLRETIKSLIPEEIRNRIRNVNKTQPAYDVNESSFTQTTEDDVWIPSYAEVFNSNGLYHTLFPDATSRIKKKVGASSASWWWLRSANGTRTFGNVHHNGTSSNSNSPSQGGLALGFCT